ncbi:MAG: HD domain-containing protein [Patescibacteria group bacterium]
MGKQTAARYNPQPLDNVIGCLKSLRTDESKARRHPNADATLTNFPRNISPFALDYLLIITLSAAFRRLVDKTQVIPAYFLTGDVRTRADHTIGVAYIAKRIAQLLGLNEMLAEVVAICHDSGHVPYAHSTEKTFSEKFGRKFHHSTNGPIVLQKIDNNGRGIPLTNLTFGGILAHTSNGGPLVARTGPPEWTIVMFADKIEFVAKDIAYFLAKGISLPTKNKNLFRLYRWFGGSAEAMIENCINALVLESAKKGYASFECSEAAKNFLAMYKIMYDDIYHVINREDELWKIIEKIYARLQDAIPEVDPSMLIALSTERDLERILAPRYKQQWIPIARGSFDPKLIEFLKNTPIDMTDPGLNW